MSAFTGAEAAIAGAGTFVWSGSGTLVNVVDITINRSVALHDTTASGMQERKFNRGLGASDGTMKCFHDTGSAPIAAGATGTLTFTAYTGRIYTIKIIIESANVDWKTDGTCEVTYNWKQSGTGASTDYAQA